MTSQVRSSLQSVFVLVLAFFAMGCPGPASNSPTPSPVSTITSVTVSPRPETLGVNQSQLFIATVSGTGSYSNAATWSISGGSVAYQTGGALIWTTPSATGSHWVKATSNQDPSKSDTVIITVTAGTPVSITSFTASPASISPGQVASLTPVFTNATSASINNGVGTVTSGVAYNVTPAATTTYTLTANGTGGPVTSTVTVTVNTGTPVSITSFTVAPTTITSLGTVVLMSPVFANATSASINNGVGSVTSGVVYTAIPTSTTTYTLTANGIGGPVTRSVTVTVNIGTPVSITSFTATPSTISVGQVATLTPVFTNATSASIDNGVGAVTSGVAYTVMPASTTTYTLTANGTGGPVTRAVTVTVNGPSTTVLSGNVVDAPLIGASVQVFAMNTDGSKGQLLGTTTTDSSGNYSVNLSPPQSAPVLAVATGGSYIDEVKGTAVPLLVGDSLEAVLPGGTTQATITPLTSMAAARARALAKSGTPLVSAVSSSNIGVAQQYNLMDILAASPNSARNAQAMQLTTRDDRYYSLVLAGISQEAAGLNVRAIDLARALATDLQDGILDGKNGTDIVLLPIISGGSATPLAPHNLPAYAGTIALQDAINVFIGSPLNQSNIGGFSITVGAVPVGAAGVNPLLITTTVLPAWTSAQFSTVTLTAAGGLPGPNGYVWTLTAGALPPNIGFANGIISGTAPALQPGSTASVSSPFTVTVTDGAGAHADRALTFTILAPRPRLIPITGGVMTQFMYGAVPVATGAGGVPPLHFAHDSFAYGPHPLGTVMDENGILKGTPGVAQDHYFNFKVCVIDSIGMKDCGFTDITVKPSNPFQGTITGGWSGLCYGAVTVSGSFSLVIAADGSVSGTYSGDAAGTIVGQVSSSGAYTAGSGGGSGGASWTGTFSKSGTTLSASGQWSSPPDCGGGWSGTGVSPN